MKVSYETVILCSVMNDQFACWLSVRDIFFASFYIQPYILLQICISYTAMHIMFSVHIQPYILLQMVWSYLHNQDGAYPPPTPKISVTVTTINSIFITHKKNARLDTREMKRENKW